MGDVVHSALSRPGNVIFPTNFPYVRDLVAAGGRCVRQPSGHLIFYDRAGRRFLATDPDGNPLHECEWETTPAGHARLVRARFRLDWEQWVGLKPAALVNATTLDLSRKPGWERLRADDLRRMAAQVLGVPLEEVRFFYGDEDLVVDARGLATIRHKKDAFYVLDSGSFDHARFMSCMGVMHWDRIDFLPVVELFQSLLPGTGSAALEFIRGLYDDQNEGRPNPLALRYRGIPTYPSEAAFRLFGGFFTPSAPGGQDPFSLFMNPSRSHEVTWLPTPDPPRRYFDPAHRLCVTVKGETIHKATLADDPTGLPYVKPPARGFAPYGRSVEVSNGRLILRDGEHRITFPLNPTWGPIRDSAPPPGTESAPWGWRDLFQGTPPVVSAAEAFGSVLLYPEDDTEIDEAASQPFVTDFLQDFMEDTQLLASHLAHAVFLLIDNFDAGLSACIKPDRARCYTVLYRRPALAQKHAQALWNQAALSGPSLEALRRVAFFPAEACRKAAYAKQYDVIYHWIPFADFDRPAALSDTIRCLAEALAPGGLVFVAGPPTVGRLVRTYALELLREDPVETLPTFQMHRTILPMARLKPGLTLVQAKKSYAGTSVRP